MDKDLSKFLKLDERLVKAAKSVKILTKIAWPAKHFDIFLKAWHSGSPKLPEVEPTKVDFKEEHEELMAIMKECSREHPIGNFIFNTASSYFLATQMLENWGTSAFTELSTTIYGAPETPIARGLMTNLETAEHFIKVTDDFIGASEIKDSDYCVLPSHVADEMRKVIEPFFSKHKVKIVLDPSLASKAAAGAYKIRIRGGTCFSDMDTAQLINHEAFVHTLTMLNGREQPKLKSLGLGAPRTTRTQEGLAIFAELITNSMDLNRLRRIALRVKAIQMALEGANFIEVFKFFLESGQNEHESYASTIRVFRGGDVKGRIAFTKDVVYLPGLVFIHTFLLKAVQAGKFHYPHLLFSGRMTLGDVFALEPYFDSGLINRPLYEPSWINNRPVLLAFLVYSAFANRIKLGQLTLDDFSRD